MSIIKNLLLPLFLFFSFNACSVNKIKSQMNDFSLTYELSMPNPNTHFFDVNILLSQKNLSNAILTADYIDFKLPVWAPGSYLVREYAKNVEAFTATTNGKKLKFQKINKNTWRVFKNDTKDINISYSVYAYELTVRTSYLDDQHGYVNGTSMFMFIPGLENNKCKLTVIPHKTFAKVSVALPQLKSNVYEVENYDLLVDSPIEIGNQDIIEFEAQGIKHTIANYSNKKIDYDKTKLIKDYTSIIDASVTVVGEKHPCKNYLFIIHHQSGIGGGLEHLNSTTCQTSTDVYQNETKYKSFLGLLAHEYFHLWNVKRIRPIAFGPFDYENENYSNMLWVSEGFTSFYQDDLLKRAKFIDQKSFLNMCAVKIATIENAPGNQVQSAAESSWDAWIKFYRPNENANNSTISYYTKGGVIANILNLIIIDNTNAEKSLDDVFKLLWSDYYIKQNRGFTDKEFKEACQKVAGINLDSFFENHIFGTKVIDYKKYYNAVGIDFLGEDIAGPWLGMSVRNGTITRTDKGSSAYEDGLYVNDVILTVDNNEFKDIESTLKNKSIGDELKFKVLRYDAVLEYTIKVKANPNKRFSLKYQEKLDELTEKKYLKFMHE